MSSTGPLRSIGSCHLRPCAPDELARLRSLAADQVRDTVLQRIDGYIGAAARGERSVHGVLLRYARTTWDPENPHAAESYRVGGLPG